MKKKLFISVLALLLSIGILTLPTSVFAQRGQDATEKEAIRPKFINDIRNRKVNVRTYYEYSPYETVSKYDHYSEGSITITETFSFGTTFSGDIKGLGIAPNLSFVRTETHTFTVKPNKRVRVVCRKIYEVESGINEYYDVTTGRVEISVPYTVKIPKRCEWRLIEY